jgi:hypothetical protein
VDEPIFTPLYSDKSEGGYVVGVEKPGKEFVRTKSQNQNDMRPTVFKADRRVERNLSFGDIWMGLEAMGKENQESLEVVGALLFRAAYLLDHRAVDGDSMRYFLLPYAREYLEANHSEISGYPPATFLFLLDVLGMNEDVKYWTLAENREPGKGRERVRSGTGRRNTLLTAVNFVASLQGKKTFADFFDGMSKRRGVAPIGQGEGRSLFPLLGP